MPARGRNRRPVRRRRDGWCGSGVRVSRQTGPGSGRRRDLASVPTIRRPRHQSPCARPDGRDAALTAKEYEILRILSVHAGQVVTAETLLRQAWGDGGKRAGADRVRAFVKQIRARLGDDAAGPRWILNVRGVGYRMPGPGED